MIIITDYNAHRFPISAKCIVYYNGKYLLRKNERLEWELLGGKLEQGESPSDCAIRELQEESGLKAEVCYLHDVWNYHLSGDLNVIIITYLCRIKEESLPERSLEGAELAWFSLPQIDALNMPNGYKESIQRHAANLSSC